MIRSPDLAPPGQFSAQLFDAAAKLESIAELCAAGIVPDPIRVAVLVAELDALCEQIGASRRPRTS